MKRSQLTFGTQLIVRVGPASLKGASHPGARDAPAAPLTLETRPFGPDGEGHAEGQVRKRLANLRGLTEHLT
jgi:hypothetical protein